MENVGVSFNAHGMSEEFIEKWFHKYVERNIDISDEKKEPLCPFHEGGECNVAYSDECYQCDISKRSFQRLFDQVMDWRPERKAAKVFCVSCGAGKRTPLRKWHNSYICSECWKIKEAIGEEAFIERLMKSQN